MSRSMSGEVPVFFSAITLPIIYALKNSQENKRIMLEQSLKGKVQDGDFDLKAYFLHANSSILSITMRANSMSRSMSGEVPVFFSASTALVIYPLAILNE